MTEKEIVDAVQKAIVETNSVKDDLNAKITELNSSIEAKDAEIKELNEKLVPRKPITQRLLKIRNQRSTN